MSSPRLFLLPVLGLGVWLSVGQIARAESADPIPQAARDRYAEGQDLEKQGKTAEAIAAYQEAERLGMRLFPRVHLKEAGAYLKLKDYDTAVAQYTKFIDNFGLEDSCRD